MKTLDLADSEELGMFSVFDGFGPKKGGFSRRRPSILGRFPIVRAKFPPPCFLPQSSSFSPVSQWYERNSRRLLFPLPSILCPTLQSAPIRNRRRGRS